MPTIAEQLQQIATIKADIKAAIEAKGETVGSDAFATYPTHIGNISGGGGEDNLDEFLSNTLTDLVFPDGLKSVRTYLCYSQTKLERVTFPASLTSIGTYAFGGCSKLGEVVIPSGVSQLQQSTFTNCTALKTVDLPSTITTMGATSLNNCKALTTLICRATTPPTVSANTFGNGTSNYTGRNTYNTGVNKLYVPQGCSSAYNTSYWASVLLDSTKCGFTIAELDANGNIPT